MKVYILQENYTEIEPEAYYDDESGGYESGEYECRDILGVFTTLEGAVGKMVEVVKDSDDSYCLYRTCMSGYEIYVADTETSKVEIVKSSIYRDMFKSKQLDMEVKTIREEA